MKLIIPAELQSADAPVCPSFGRAPFFVLYDTEDKAYRFLDNAAAAAQGGAGIKAAQILADGGAGILITYRCGQNAADVLKAAHIQIYQAREGTIAENIRKWERGELSPLTDAHPGFHNHGGKGQ